MLSPYQNFVVIDCETGGLPSKEKKAVHQIALTEFAFVALNSNLEIVDQASWLIKPYKDDLIYDPRAAEVSGITKQLCEEEGIPIEQAVKEMIAFLKKYKVQGKFPTLVGHCIISFDAAFLINAFEFCGEDIGKYVHSEIEDTIKWARLFQPEATNYKLGTCCEDAGITLQDGHRALVDTLATANLFSFYMKNLRGLGKVKEENGEENTDEPKSFRDNFEM